MTSTQRIVAGCLIGLAIALLIVGVASGTVVRHIVQILPIVLAGAVLARSPHVGAYAALPIFLFWLFIVVLIWLFLLGLSNIASGRYTVIEVVSTVFMAGFSLVGVRQSISLGVPVPLTRRILLCIPFGVVQVGAMWVSFLKPITGANPDAAARSPIDTGHMTVDGGALFYESAGSGPPVVLLHGGNLDRRMWDEQFILLSRQYHVVRYDARGFGRSTPADRPYAAHDDLAALLRGLHIKHASLIGLSMGGRIAIDFALAYPAMVDRLVLAAPGISGGKWADDADTVWIANARNAAKRGDSVGVALAWLGSAYIRTAAENPALAPRVRRLVVDQARYWMGIVRHQDVEREASPPAAGRLEELRAPTLLLVGDRDTPFIADVARAIVARAERVRRVDIPQAGHMLNLEASSRFNDEVLRFLASKCPPKIACT